MNISQLLNQIFAAYACGASGTSVEMQAPHGGRTLMNAIAGPYCKVCGMK